MVNRFHLSGTWAILLLSAVSLSCHRSVQEELPSFELNSASEVGDTAVSTIRYLSNHLPGRSIGTTAEAQTVSFLVQQLESLNYEVSLQPFVYDWWGKELTSYNIVGKRPGTSDKQILIGAHYDNAPSQLGLSRRKLEGTNDNASGIGVALELAQRLTEKPKHTVKFIFFGAEEIGKIGSQFYADSLSEQEVHNSLLMINLDSLIVGDKIYFNAGRGAVQIPDWFQYRDLALEIATENGIAMETNPGLHPDYPEGTGCCSDSESFDFIMPVLVAEATNWELGEQDGYTQTSHAQVPNGQTWHDPATDNLRFTNEVFPGLLERRTYEFTLVLSQLLEQLTLSPES